MLLIEALRFVALPETVNRGSATISATCVATSGVDGLGLTWASVIYAFSVKQIFLLLIPTQILTNQRRNPY